MFYLNHEEGPSKLFNISLICTNWPKMLQILESQAVYWEMFFLVIIAINRVGGLKRKHSHHNWCKYQIEDQSYLKFSHKRISSGATTKEKVIQDQYQLTIKYLNLMIF